MVGLKLYEIQPDYDGSGVGTWDLYIPRGAASNFTTQPDRHFWPLHRRADPKEIATQLWNADLHNVCVVHVTTREFELRPYYLALTNPNHSKVEIAKAYQVLDYFVPRVLVEQLSHLQLDAALEAHLNASRTEVIPPYKLDRQAQDCWQVTKIKPVSKQEPASGKIYRNYKSVGQFTATIVQHTLEYTFKFKSKRDQQEFQALATSFSYVFEGEKISHTPETLIESILEWIEYQRKQTRYIHVRKNGDDSLITALDRRELNLQRDWLERSIGPITDDLSFHALLLELGYTEYFTNWRGWWPLGLRAHPEHMNNTEFAAWCEARRNTFDMGKDYVELTRAETLVRTKPEQNSKPND